MNFLTWVLIIAALWYTGFLKGFLMWMAVVLMSTASMIGAGI
jgi:hypothetical protein